jgi:hypothetical protein
MERGYAYGNLCELNLKAERNIDSAVQQCRKAVAFEQRAYRKSGNASKIAQDLANRHGWMANAYFKVGNLNSAIASRIQEKALLEKLLADDPKNVEYALRRSWADIGLASYYFELGEPARVPALLEPHLSGKIFGSADADNRVTETRFRIALNLAKAAELLRQDPTQYLAIAKQFDATLQRKSTNWPERSLEIRGNIFGNRRTTI